MDFDDNKYGGYFGGEPKISEESPFTEPEPSGGMGVMGGSIVGSLRNGHLWRATVEIALIVSMLMLVFVLFWGWAVPTWMWIFASISTAVYVFQEYTVMKIIPGMSV